MLKTRVFSIIKIDSKSGAGDKPMQGGKEVYYKGKEIKIHFK